MKVYQKYIIMFKNTLLSMLKSSEPMKKLKPSEIQEHKILMLIK